MTVLVRNRSSAANLDPSLWARAGSIDGNAPLCIKGASFVEQQPQVSEDVDKEAALEARVLDWCRHTPQVSAALGAPIRATAIAGGLTNHSFVVEGPRGAVFVKQAEAFHRVATAIPLDVARLATEAEGMRLGHACAPEAVPACLHIDREANMLATEFVQGREMLASALLRGASYPGLTARLGASLARLARGTSPRALGARAFGRLEAAVAESAGVADMMEDHVLYLPFDRAAPHNSWPAELSGAVEALVHGDAGLMRELAALQALRREPGATACLAHTDAWLNNILVPAWAGGGGAAAGAEGAAATVVDWEFGCIGPSSYDVGHTIGMLVLAALLVRAYSDLGLPAADGARVPPARRREQEEWLAASVGELWGGFERAWGERRPGAAALWGAGGGAPPAPALADALGYAGCTIIRWSIGQFNIFKNLGVSEGGPEFAAAVGRSVRVGAALLRRRREIGSAAEAAELLRAELA